MGVGGGPGCGWHTFFATSEGGVYTIHRAGGDQALAVSEEGVNTAQPSSKRGETLRKREVDLVRQMLDDYLRGDYEAALPAFAHDVEVVTSLERYHGHAGVVKEAKRWAEMWSDYRFEVEGLVDAGDRVVLLYHQVGRAKGSGAEVEERAGWVYTVYEGKIVRVEMFQDRETALRAAGLKK